MTRADATAFCLARDRDADKTRAAARWKAIRTFWWGRWDAERAVLGGYTLSVGEELRRLRKGER